MKLYLKPLACTPYEESMVICRVRPCYFVQEMEKCLGNAPCFPVQSHTYMDYKYMPIVINRQNQSRKKQCWLTQSRQTYMLTILEDKPEEGDIKSFSLTVLELVSKFISIPCTSGTGGR